MISDFDKFVFEHKALPEIDYSEVNASVTFFGKIINLPIIMHVRHLADERVFKMRRQLAELAVEWNIALSIDCAHLEPEDCESIAEITENIPLIVTVPVMSLKNDEASVFYLVETLRANALMLHINPMFDLFCSERGGEFSGLLQHIRALCMSTEIPILAREGGCGISVDTARHLFAAGVRGVDCSGKNDGIPLFSVEDVVMQRVLDSFKHWGRNTPEMIIELHKNFPRDLIIASGNINTGLDVAKALALGANMCLLDHQIVERIMQNRTECENYMEEVSVGLKTAMFLSGSRTIQELRERNLMIYGNYHI